MSAIFSQENLVPNGSFEEYSECPTANELNSGQFERALGWTRPTKGTPDFFHECNNSISGVVGVPSNFVGHQESMFGKAYSGFIVSWKKNGEYLDFEYVKTRLKHPLKPCYTYKVSFYVTLAKKSSHGLKKLGVLLTQSDFFIDTWLTIDSVPTFFNNSLVLNDTSSWTKIEGNFVAKGNENYLSLGYFFDNVKNDTTCVQPDSFESQFSYYYVDSIQLFEIGPAMPSECNISTIVFPNVFTPNNDGINDNLNFKDFKLYAEEILILNRWGNVVFRLNENNPIWQGENCPDGVYFYQINFRNNDFFQTGFIQLIRGKP